MDHPTSAKEFAASLAPSDLETLTKLLTRPWWQRTWVIQEFTLARTVFMHCGSSSLLWKPHHEYYATAMVDPFAYPLQFFGTRVERPFPQDKYPGVHYAAFARELYDITQASLGLLYSARKFHQKNL